MQSEVGDELIVDCLYVSEPARKGEILEVRVDDGPRALHGPLGRQRSRDALLRRSDVACAAHARLSALEGET
jgi:hypothetical protein